MDLNIIKGKMPLKYDNFFAFTNESLASYENLMNFSGSKVLSVIGSGDQYFASLLFGSESIDVFDNNIYAIYYFILKFVGIRILSYDEFMDFFFDSRMSKIEIYDKIRINLPKEVREYFDMNKDKISLLAFEHHMYKYEKKRIEKTIPYFDKNKYYILKKLLNNINYPKIYAMDLLELPKNLEEYYDIMLLSNIFWYLRMSEKKFIKFIKSELYPYLNSGGIIQTDYCWGDVEFLTRLRFRVKAVPTAFYSDRSVIKDHVSILKK